MGSPTRPHQELRALRWGRVVVGARYGDGVSELVSRQPPKRAGAKLADLTLIVRPPGRPDAIRTFTDAEREQAETYAAAAGATVEPLT